MADVLSPLTSYASSKNQVLTLESIMIRGLAAKMQGYFKLKSTPLLITSNDKWRIISSIYKQANEKIEFPILVFRPSTYEINAESYNPKALYRMGRLGSLTDNGTSANRLEIIPVRFNIEVSFLTDDYHTMATFSNRWLFASTNKALNMNVTFDGHGFPIQVTPDAAITMPQKDNTPDMVNLFEVESTLYVSGYMSLAEDLDQGPKVPIINQINVGLIAGEEGTEPFDTITLPKEE